MTKAKQAKKEEAPNESLPATAADNAGLGGLGDFTEESLLGSALGRDEGGTGDATAADIRDGMGNRKPQLESIKVKHQGVNAFHFPDGRKVDGEDGIVGVVIAYTYHNSNFEKSFDDHEEGEQPACWSNDGTNVASEVESPRNEGGCQTCPFNRDALDKGAREQAWEDGVEKQTLCSNYLSLAVALPGQDIPQVLRITATSFKAWSIYVQQLGTRGRFRPYQVLTRIKLRNVKRGANENSQAEFDVAGDKFVLPKALQSAFKLQSVSYRSLLRRDAELAGPSDEAAHAMDGAKAAADAAGSEEAAL